MSTWGFIHWRVRRPGASVEIVIHPARPDEAAREASVVELRRLVFDFKYRDPEALRVVLAIHARLSGSSGPQVHELDTASPRAEAIAQELLRAARAGVILARRREWRPVAVS